MIALTVIDANDQLLEAELDGATFFLRLSWNETGQFWTLAVRDAAHTTLISSVTLVPGLPLLRQHRRPELPKGELMVVSRVEPLGRQSFVSGDAALLYATQAEMVAAGWASYA